MKNKDRIVKFENWNTDSNLYHAVFNTAANEEIALSLNQVVAEIKSESPFGRQREAVLELEEALRKAPHKEFKKDVQVLKTSLG